MAQAQTQRFSTVGDNSARRFGYYPQLDGMRGLSILLVLIGHAYLQQLSRLGALGVMFFFVLSGFLITGLLCEESSTTGTVSLERFYTRRALRILPAFVVLVAVTSALIASGLITDVPWYTVAVSCLYLNDVFGTGQSLGHLWSLSLEEQFYLVWPLLMRTFSRRRMLPVACIAAAAIIMFRATAIHFEWWNYNSAVFYERPWFRFDSILAGCILALLFSNSAAAFAWVRRLVRFP